MKPTTVILASGKGRRMESVTQQFGLPKHLLPIGNNQSPISRLIHQTSHFSQKILCIVETNQYEIFHHYLKNTGVEIIEKGKGKAFLSDIEALNNTIKNETQVLITTGDLIFDNTEIEKIYSSIKEHTTTLGLEFPGGIDIALRFFSTPSQNLQKLIDASINTENIYSMIRTGMKVFGKDILQGKVMIKKTKVLLNLNTPQDYDKAKLLASSLF